MRVLIDGKTCEALTPAQEKDIRQFREEASVQGQVLSADEATTARGRQTRTIFAILWGVVAVVAALLASLAGPADQPIVLPAAALILFLLGAFFVFNLRRRQQAWRRDLPRRLEGLASEGTAIGVDAAGVTVGGRVHAWPALAIEQVELGKYSSQRSTLFTLDRLALRGPEGLVVLDPGMMGNGHLLIGNAWRRMRAAATAG